MSIIAATGANTTAQPGYDIAKGGAATQRDLLLKLFSGEVLATFETKTVIRPYIRSRSVSGQKSAQFPTIGKAAADYHQPGERIDGQKIAHGETTLVIDDMLISPVFVSNFEEALTHFETRGEYSRQMGDSLAQAYDRKGFATALKACYDGLQSKVPTHGAASRTPIGATWDVSAFVDSVYQAQAELDANDIPENDRVLFVPAYVYYDLIKDGRFLNKDFGNEGNGSQANASIVKVAGLPLVKTNNMARNHALNVEREGSVITDFNVDASTARGLILQRQALGALHLMDISTEAEYQVERQGTLMVSRMANGMGVLRPECLKLLDGADV